MDCEDYENCSIWDLWDIHKESEISQIDVDAIKMDTIRKACKDMGYKTLNDYFWCPDFNVLTNRELYNLRVEAQRLAMIEQREKNLQRIASLNDEKEKEQQQPAPAKPPEVGPPLYRVSNLFKEKIRKFIENIDPRRTLLCRPSCSTADVNFDEYKDTELLTNKDIAPVVKQMSKVPVIQYSAPKSATASNLPNFPDSRSEKIYRYVLDVLSCFQERRDLYKDDRVFNHVSWYRKKMKVVQMAFDNNYLGIRDKLVQEDNSELESDVEMTCTGAFKSTTRFRLLWKTLTKKVSALEDAKEKMSQNRFDRETLAIGKKMGHLVIHNMREISEELGVCMDAIREVYGSLLLFDCYLKKPQREFRGRHV